ncbi:MAG: Ig-like domain-containing protein [Synergistaceae bacterium]|jgi:predicted outer membrane repeat protein|nr:Ig-like domain-containing protein [Synergistaceae bacterium]
MKKSLILALVVLTTTLLSACAPAHATEHNNVESSPDLYRALSDSSCTKITVTRDILDAVNGITINQDNLKFISGTWTVATPSLTVNGSNVELAVRLDMRGIEGKTPSIWVNGDNAHFDKCYITDSWTYVGTNLYANASGCVFDYGELGVTGDSSGINLLAGEVEFNAVSFRGQIGLLVNGGTANLRHCYFDSSYVPNTAIELMTGNVNVDGPDNNFSNKAGGAIIVRSGSVTFKENSYAVFSNNTGGAMYVENGKVYFNGTADFTTNSAISGSKGSVYIKATTPEGVNFNGTTTFSGSVGCRALDVSGGTVNFTTTNITTFKDNSLGAVDISSGTVYVKGTVSFQQNGKDLAGDTGVGGAIKLSSIGWLSIDGAKFTGNNAVKGGAIYAEGGSPTLNIVSSEFEENKATNSGGAIHIANNIDVTFQSGKFSRNSVTNGNGGAIYLAQAAGDRIKFNGGTLSFSENTANAGGAIYSDMASAYLRFIGVTADFSENSAIFGDGGAVYAQAGIRFERTGRVTFDRNTAANSGGAIYNNTVGVAFEGTDATFSNNIATNGDGGAARVAAFTFNKPIYGTPTAWFTSNSAANSGGALYSTGAVYIERGELRNNVASTGSGGAIYTSTVAGSVTLHQNFFYANTCGLGTPVPQGQAGGALSSAGLITLGECTFENNQAREYGGAVDVRFSGNGTNLLDRSMFLSNSAADKGGAIYVGESSASTVEVSFSMLTANQVNDTDNGGGAVYFAGQGNGTFNRCTFTENTAYLQREPNKADAMVTINGGEPAIEGGAVMAVTKGDKGVRFINCTFTRNQVYSMHATCIGGALYLSGRSEVYFCTITDKNAVSPSSIHYGLGGGIYIDKGANQSFTMAATAVVGNSAPYGNDIFRSENVTLMTYGYNRIGTYGIISVISPFTPTVYTWASDGLVQGAKAYDIESLGQDEMFPTGSNVLRANYFDPDLPLASLDIGVGTDLDGKGPYYLLTVLPNANDSQNAAVNQIPARQGQLMMTPPYIDERGVPRPQPPASGNETGQFDIGAVELWPAEGAGFEPGGQVTSVKMGGIPDRMSKIGQECILVATVFPTEAGISQEVIWSSTNPAVATIDQNGLLKSIGVGSTTIVVTSVELKANGQPAVASRVLVVKPDEEYEEPPAVVVDIEKFNDFLKYSGYGESLEFMIDGAYEKMTSRFNTGFRSVYGVTPEVVELTNYNLSPFKAVPTGDLASSDASASGWTAIKAIKPGLQVKVIMQSKAGGAVLPMKFSWTLTKSELSKLLGRDVEGVPDVTLFKTLNIGFTGADGVTVPVVNADGAAGGVRASDAQKESALFWNKTGEDDITVALEVFLADVQPVQSEAEAKNIAASVGGVKMNEGVLTVADGAADGTIEGTMWLLHGSDNNDDGNGGNVGRKGGGGCSATSALGYALAYALALAIGVRMGRSRTGKR